VILRAWSQELAPKNWEWSQSQRAGKKLELLLKKKTNSQIKSQGEQKADNLGAGS